MSQDQIIISFIIFGIYIICKYIFDIKNINKFTKNGTYILETRFQLAHRKSILENILLRNR